MENFVLNLTSVILSHKAASVLVLIFVIIVFIKIKHKKPINKEHCQKMKQQCLEVLNSFSIVAAMYPRVSPTVFKLATEYIQNLKLKEFQLLNDSSVRGYIYSVLYTIPLRAIPRITNQPTNVINYEIAGFCIQYIDCYHEEFPFIPDEKIKNLKYKVIKKYKTTDKDFIDTFINKKGGTKCTDTIYKK